MDYNILREERTILSLVKEAEKILKGLKKEIKIMEVCGTHTMTAYRSGLGNFLRKKGVKLISGPGCPVCITPDYIIGFAVEIVTSLKDVILTSFGDMLKVPTKKGNLLQIIPKEGSYVQIIYSPEEVLNIAKNNPNKHVIFLAVGFETTIPSIGWVVKESERQDIKNLSFITSLHLVPPPLKAILSQGEVKIDGFLYPGHVSVIIGSKPYQFIAKEFLIPGAVTGFEPVDLMLGVLSVLRQIESNSPKVDIAYKRAVKEEGNEKAKKIIEEVFEISDVEWRGFGIIPKSGLKLKNKKLDALEIFKFSTPQLFENKGCRCGDVLKGLIEPNNCPLFKNVCTPESPVGPCMVSVEGSCLIHYKYGSLEWIE